MLLAALIADARDHGALDAADNVRVVIEFLDHLGDGLDLSFGGMRFHYDDQVINPLRDGMDARTLVNLTLQHVVVHRNKAPAAVGAQ